MSEIPSRDFGRLEATVHQLEQRLEKTVLHFEDRITLLTESVDNLTAALNQAKGGWQVIAGVAGVSVAATTLVIKTLAYFRVV